MARVNVIVGTLLIAAAPALSQVAKAPLVQVSTNFPAAQEKAQRGGMMMMLIFTQGANPASMRWEKEVLSDKEFAEAAQHFSICRLEITSPLAKTYKLDPDRIPQTVFAFPDGKELDKIAGAGTPAQMVKIMGGATQLLEKKLLESLEPDLASKNPTVVANALGKVGQMHSKKATEILLDVVKRQEAPDAVRKAAVEGLGRQGTAAGAEDLVPLISHKNPALRSAAQQAMIKIGTPSAGFALDGLEGESAEHRAACFAVAKAVTKYSKARDAKFWQTGDEDKRKAAAAEWKEWWAKNKPPEAVPVN